MSVLTITLPGSVRSKKNHKQLVPIGGRRMKRRIIAIPSDAYTKWETEARRQVTMDLLESNMLIHPIVKESPVHIEAHFFVKGPLPDLSGALESLGDCMEGILYANDKQIVSWDGSRVHHSIDNPHTQVTVRWPVESTR